MITAEEWVKQQYGVEEVDHIDLNGVTLVKDLIDFAKEAIKADRENLLNHAKVLKECINPITNKAIEDETYCSSFFREDIGYEDYIPVDFTVDKNSILNAPQIELL